MRIAVMIKQVPATDKMKIDEKTGTLVRDAKSAMINPYDWYALEEAVRIKSTHGAHVTVLSMGIASVRHLLKDALAIGVDRAILLNDRAFAGSDTLATAYVLSCALRCLEPFDLYICGKQAIDGDTAQVGPGLAQKLGVPHITQVGKIHTLYPHEGVFTRLLDNKRQTIKTRLPALITVVKEINTPRFASIAGFLYAQTQTVEMWGAVDIGAQEAKIGLKGSPTRVIKTVTPSYKTGCSWIAEDDPKRIEKLLAQIRPDVSNNEEL